MNNADQIKFRCSSLGHLMTESRSKSEPISETTKTHLIDVYVSEVYGRRTDISNKYIAKGNQVEDDSITLFSRVNKEFFTKNEKHLSNEYIKGTPDLFKGESIEKATEIIDIKSSWDIFTYFRTKGKDMNKLYYWQLMGYMALTGAETATLAYCLVDTPDTLVNDEKRKLHWKMGLIDDQNPDFIEACEKIDKLSKYDDIPLKDKVYTINFERNETDINRIYQRVMEAREWMNKNLFTDV
jgi:hypothetical protein